MANTALTTFRRSEFIGRTDKYAPPLRPGDMPVALYDVIKGEKPVDVSGVVLDDVYVQDSISRLNAYRKYWNYYMRKQFTVEYDGGNKKTAFNFCRKIVDKRANWIAGKGFAFYSEKGNELVSSALERVWTANRGRAFIRRSAKTSVATGDVFWYFTVKTKDARGKELPKEKWYIAIYPLNPAYVFPIWTEANPCEMAACMIQFPQWGGQGGKTTTIFTAFMTPDTIDFYSNYEKTSSTPNVLGRVPVVHIPNSPVGDQLFGLSVLEDIIPLNDSYNEISASIRRIIAYHGEPTTIVYGARLSQMERGANKVWSNLPPPDLCRVENLQMTSDLSATYKYLDEVKAQIYAHGKTPKMAFDSEGLAISNTSGIAMQLMFQPLIEATTEEQDQYTLALHKGNQLIADMHKTILGEDLSILADNQESYLEMEVVWQSLLPKDEQTDVDLATKKVQMGIWSRAEAARRLSGVKDTEKLALELAADSRYDIAIAAEKARALNLQKPNFSAAFLSSLFLSEDLLDTASKIGDLADEDSKNGDSGESDAEDTEDATT